MESRRGTLMGGRGRELMANRERGERCRGNVGGGVMRWYWVKIRVGWGRRLRWMIVRLWRQWRLLIITHPQT